MEPAGGIQENHVVAVAAGVLHSGLGDIHRINLPHLEHRNAELFTHYLQLLDGGAVDIAGTQQGPLAVLFFHQAGQLRAIGGLARAL